MKKLLFIATMASSSLFANPVLDEAFERLQPLNPALESDREEIKDILMDLYKNHSELFDGSRCLKEVVKSKTSKSIKKLCLEK